jgi:hypothetical protein
MIICKQLDIDSISCNGGEYILKSSIPFDSFNFIPLVGIVSIILPMLIICIIILNRHVDKM